MSTLATTPFQGHSARYRWSGEDFDRAVNSGIFGSQHVELINGDILERTDMNPPHAYAVQNGTYALLRIFPPEQYTVRVQLPMRLGESRPLPDFAVIGGTPDQNFDHPKTAILVIEISDTTLDADQTEMMRLYAEHGIPEYWVVDVNARQVYVRRKPNGLKGQLADYLETELVASDKLVRPLAAPHSTIAVAAFVRPTLQT
jgi:Uma2 family endonuclease